MSAPTPDRGAERRAPQRSHELLLAATVGVVLADSSIVTLALPEILAGSTRLCPGSRGC
jgi:hypothetical protein